MWHKPYFLYCSSHHDTQLLPIRMKLRAERRRRGQSAVDCRRVTVRWSEIPFVFSLSSLLRIFSSLRILSLPFGWKGTSLSNLRFTSTLSNDLLFFLPPFMSKEEQKMERRWMLAWEGSNSRLGPGFTHFLKGSVPLLPRVKARLYFNSIYLFFYYLFISTTRQVLSQFLALPSFPCHHPYLNLHSHIHELMQNKREREREGS